MSRRGDYKPAYLCPPWKAVIDWLVDNGYRRGRVTAAAILYYNHYMPGPSLLLYMDLGGRIIHSPIATQENECMATPWSSEPEGGWLIALSMDQARSIVVEALDALGSLKPRIVVLSLSLAPAHCASVRSVAGWTPLVLAQDYAPLSCTGLRALDSMRGLAGF